MFSGRVGEAVVELLVDVALNGGDLFLLGGLERQRQKQSVREVETS